MTGVINEEKVCYIKIKTVKTRTTRTTTKMAKQEQREKQQQETRRPSDRPQINLVTWQHYKLSSAQSYHYL